MHVKKRTQAWSMKIKITDEHKYTIDGLTLLKRKNLPHIDFRKLNNDKGSYILRKLGTP